MNEAYARALTDAILPPVRLAVGRRYLHPEDGLVEITSGFYRDPTFGRLSNFWYWVVVATGEQRCGYGGDWPEATP